MSSLAPGTTASSVDGAGARRSPLASPSSSAARRARGEPGVDLRPGALGRAAADHDPDVTARYAQHLLVRAADFLDHRRRLAGWSDVVILGDDIEQVCAKVGEVHLLAAQREGPAHQLVLTIEVDDELAICRRCHRDPVVE